MVAKGLAGGEIASGGARQPWWRELYARLRLAYVRFFSTETPCDAEFGSLDQATRRSAGGYCVKLAGALIDWGCRFHRITSQSTAESEYYTLSDCVNALLHLRQLFAELEQGDNAPTLAPTLVYEDNGSVIAWAKTRKIHRAAKHIQIRYHAVKQYVLPNGTEVDLQPIPSAVQVADYFTKSLAKYVLERHLRVAGHTKIQG